MTSDAYPMHGHASPFQRISRLMRGWIRRAQTIDVHYVDSWERKRR